MSRLGRPSFPAAHPWWTILGWTILTVTSAGFLAWKGIEVDNGIDVFLVKDDPERERFQAFREQFGSNEILVVGQEDADLLTNAGLERSRRCSARILAADQELMTRGDYAEAVVAEVRGFGDLALVQDLVARGRAAEIDQLPLVPRTFYGRAPTGRPIGLTFVLLNAGVRGKDRASFFTRLEALLAEDPIPGGTWRIAGSPALNFALDQASRAQTKRLFPVLFAVALLVLLGLTKSIRATLVLATTVIVAVPITLAVFVAFGSRLNMITTTIPAVLMVLGFAGSLHLYRAFATEDGMSVPNPLAADRARRQVWRANAIAALATALGFLSLVTSALLPIQEMGATAAYGIGISFLVATSLTPALLSLGTVPRNRAAIQADPGEMKLLPPRLVLPCFALLAGVAALGLPRLEVESAALRFLPKSHRIRLDWDALETAGFGLSPVEIHAGGSADDSLKMPTLVLVARATEQAAAVPSVRRALSIVDALDYVRRELALAVIGTSSEAEFQASLAALDVSVPASAPDASRPGLALVPLLPMLIGIESPSPLLLQIPPARREAIRRFLGAYVGRSKRGMGIEFRIAVMTSSTEVSQVQKTLAALLPVRASLESSDAIKTAGLTGLAPMLVRMQTYLIESQIWSLLSAALLVMVVLLFALRSPRLAMIGLIPNLAPILFMFGGLGWLGLRLDVATVMVGAIALGIAVDDTVHILSSYDASQPRSAATRRALRGVLWPVISTSIMSTLGFATLGFSDFVPLMKFGLITAAAMVIANLCDLVLLPALLLVFGPRPDRAEFFRLAGAGGVLDRIFGRERGGRMLLQLATSACSSGESVGPEQPRDGGKLFREGLLHLHAWFSQNPDPGADDPRRRQRYAAALALKARCHQGLDRVAGDDPKVREWRVQVRRDLARFEDDWKAFPDAVVCALSVRLRAEMRDGDLAAAKKTSAVMQALRPEDPQTVRGHLRVATALLDRSKSTSGEAARQDKKEGLAAYRAWVVASRPLAPEPWVNLGRGLESLEDPEGALDVYEKMLGWFETRAPVGQADLVYKVQRRLARLYLDRGDRTAARDVYFRLIGARTEANPWYQSPELKTRIETIDSGRPLIADTEEMEL